jgi:hypothetical protein
VAKLGTYYVRLLQKGGKLLEGRPEDCDCCHPCTEEQKPTEWRLIEMQDRVIYASGDVNDLVLDEFPDTWTPTWYCRSPLYMAVQVKCYGEWQEAWPLEEWTTTVGLCAGFAARYPTHDLADSYASPCCTDQHTLTRGDPPPEQAVVAAVRFDGVDPCGDWEWTNLANWNGATELPTETSDVTIASGALHTASLGPPTVRNLTIGRSFGNVSFLTSITVTGTAYINTFIGRPSLGYTHGAYWPDIPACSTPFVLTGNVIADGYGIVHGTVTGDFTQTERTVNFVLPGSMTVLGVATFAEAGISQSSGTFNTLILNGASVLYTGRNINGPVTFNNTATFTGGITANQLNCPATFNDAAINSGIIAGAVTLNGNSQNQGTLSGGAVFNGSSLNLGNAGPDAVFNGSSANTKTAGSITTPARIGRVTGTATFNSGSINYSQVDGVATFNSGSRNQGGDCGGAVFNEGSDNYSGSTTSPLSPTFSGPVTFNGNSVTYGSGTTTFLAGVTFGGTSTNNGRSNGDAVFESSAVNQFVLNGNATFNGSSVNLAAGIINGNAVFNGSSVNRGRVNGDATFNDSSSNLGIVTGTKTCNTTGVC